jgi:hypothetical protein
LTVLTGALLRNDLIEAQGSVDWVLDQLGPLDQRLQSWLNENVTIEVRDVPAPATHNPIVAFEKELLPISFSVEVGAYINALRSSLDILAMALVRRHGLEIPEEKVSFPIAANEELLLRNGGSLLLKQLPGEDRERLLALRPFCGGNPAL